MSFKRTKFSAEQEDFFQLEDVGRLVDDAYTRMSTHQTMLDPEGVTLSVPAPNAIEWAVGQGWCDFPSLYEFHGQYQLVRDFFELRCPICNDPNTAEVRGKTRWELQDERLLAWSAEHEEDVCPKCHGTRSEFTEDGFFKGYNTLHAVIGQRAGKSVVSGLIGTYVEHRLITLGLSTPGGLASYFGTAKGDVFEMTFLASNDTQSQDTIWAKYCGIRAEAPWFKRYVPWVKKQEVMQFQTDGMRPWRYDENDKKIDNMHPSIRMISNSMNSNSSGLRGRTRPAAFADEISHMDQTDSKRGARMIYAALERSLRTVRSRVNSHGGAPWLGLMAAVTSPVSRSDLGWDLYQRREQMPRMFAVHSSTWEFSSKIKRADLNDEFAKDPVGARRDYEAVPPGAEFPYLHDEAKFRALAVDETLEPLVTFEQYLHTTKTNHRYLAARAIPRGYPDKRVPRVICVDAGETFDSFSVAMAHGEYTDALDPEGKPHLITVFDGICRLLPTTEVDVWFESIVDIADTLQGFVHINRAEFDRWQSIHAIQQLRNKGVFAERRSLSVDDWRRFRLDAYSGAVRMLPPADSDWKKDRPGFQWTSLADKLSAPAVAICELFGLQEDPDTGKVFNPSKGKQRGVNSNDCAQVIVHAHLLVQQLGYTEKHDDRSRRAARIRAEEGAKNWGMRGGLAKPNRTAAAILQKGPGRGW